jgi:glutaredoxin
MNEALLELYYFENCPFCKIVKNVIEEENIVVVYKDIMTNSTFAEQLIEDTGKRMVPCLYIDGKPMHESSDIIRWLKTNSNGLTKSK